MTHNFRPTQPLYDRIIYYNAGGVKNVDHNLLQKPRRTGRKSNSSIIKISDSIILYMLAIYFFKNND